MQWGAGSEGPGVGRTVSNISPPSSGSGGCTPETSRRMGPGPTTPPFPEGRPGGGCRGWGSQGLGQRAGRGQGLGGGAVQRLRGHSREGGVGALGRGYVVPSLVECWGAQTERMGRWAEEVTGAGCQGQGRGAGSSMDAEGGRASWGPGTAAAWRPGGWGPGRIAGPGIDAARGRLGPGPGGPRGLGEGGCWDGRGRTAAPRSRR